MKINELKQIIKIICSNHHYIPIMIWSGPGIGKSSAVRQVAEELKIGFIDLRLSLLNPVDLRGLPVVDRIKGEARWMPPDFLPREGQGILFLDEINLAPFAVMAAGYQLVLDRKLGEYELPEGWRVVAAGNRLEDRANVTKFPAPLANRFIHLEIEPDIDVWRKWALKNNIAEQIIAFLGRFPQHLYHMPQAGEMGFPTPRSWEMASKLFQLGQKVGSAVGEGVASEFEAFLRVYEKLPDVDKVLAGKVTEVPKEIDVLWALCMAITARIEPKQIPTMLKYVKGMPKEFEVLTIISVSNKSEKLEAALVNSAEWKEWIKENKELIEEEI